MACHTEWKYMPVKGAVNTGACAQSEWPHKSPAPLARALQPCQISKTAGRH